MNKKTKSLLLSLLLVGAIGVGATLAYFTDSQDVTNTITMGKVDIDLEEPNFPDDKTIEDVKPNQTIVKDPTITLKEGSEKAYIRAKIEYTFDNAPMSETMIEQLEAGIDMISASWVKGDDGYFYFQGILEDEEDKNSVKLFEHVTIPEVWGNEVANKSIEIKVSAEAIQADNFEPKLNELGEIVGWVDSEGNPINMTQD